MITSYCNNKCSFKDRRWPHLFDMA